MDWNVVRAWADKLEALLAGQPTESPALGKSQRSLTSVRLRLGLHRLTASGGGRNGG